MFDFVLFQPGLLTHHLKDELAVKSAEPRQSESGSVSVQLAANQVHPVRIKVFDLH